MKRNGLFRNIIAISVGFGAMVLLGTSSSKAVLQSNGNDGATYNLSDWMMNVRKMEELGGAMGLSENVDSNLTSSNGSNNIDVHMQKNTEYGALAILSASSYGNPGKVNDGETTTGNATGVVMKFDNEWTAAALKGTFDNYSARYINDYLPNYIAKRGDAITETSGWHGSSNQWVIGFEQGVGVIRSYLGIFGSKTVFEAMSWGDHSSNILNIYHSRAVVVQGDGI